MQKGLVRRFHSRPWRSMALPGGDIPCTGGALPTWEPTLSSVSFYTSLLEGPALLTQGLPCKGMFADIQIGKPNSTGQRIASSWGQFSSLPQLDDFPTMPGKEQELLVVAALTDAKA